MFTFPSLSICLESVGMKKISYLQCIQTHLHYVRVHRDISGSISIKMYDLELVCS